MYLENCITFIPNIGNNRARGNASIPLTIHAILRPLAQKEPVPRDEMIYPSKAKSEGALEEIKVVLGWLYNTHAFWLILPEPKFTSWTNTIQDILSKDKKKAKNLETLMGRLNCTASIVPLARHFLEGIRSFHSKMNAFAWYRLRPNIREDLKLHMSILQKSHKAFQWTC